jgi:hypothetical protein
MHADADADVAVAQRARQQHVTFGQCAVTLRQAGEQVLVDFAHHLRGPDMAAGPFAPMRFDGGFRLHVGERQALAPRLIRVLRVVIAQRALDVDGECMLPLDFVAVVGVHGAQQHPQLGRRAGARKTQRLTLQVVRLFEQRRERALAGQERLHLRRSVIELEFLRLADHA